jgi:RNA polymerase sigma factor (sigma-70 family)
MTTIHGRADVTREMERLFGAGSVAGLSERQLLERFAGRGDDAAFAALVDRHGPMVRATCRRLLRDDHAADDAFQATFLILARKAGSIRDAGRLGAWLHGVARRVSSRARLVEGRRARRERSGARPEAVEASPDAHADLRRVLDEELGRLPAGFRAAIVLCHLEGLSHEEAAGRLRCPVGTVRSRLARGRDRLRDRLLRRGLAPSMVAALGSVLSRESPAAAVPPGVRDAVVASALAFARRGGAIAGPAAGLATGVLNIMMVKKCLTLGVLAVGLGLLAAGTAAPAQKPADGGAEETTTLIATQKPEGDLGRMQGRWEAIVPHSKVVDRPSTRVSWVIRGDLISTRTQAIEAPEAPVRVVTARLKLDEGAEPKRLILENARAQGPDGAPIEPRDGSPVICYKFQGAELVVLTAPPGSSPSAEMLDSGDCLRFRRLSDTPEVPGDLGRMQGRWVAVSPSDHVSGAPSRKRIEWVIRDDLLSSRARSAAGEGGAVQAVSARLKLDEDAEPKRLTMTDARTEGPDGATIALPEAANLYKFEGEELIICLGRPGASPPESFGEENGSMILRFRRPAEPHEPRQDAGDLARLQGVWDRIDRHVGPESTWTIRGDRHEIRLFWPEGREPAEEELAAMYRDLKLPLTSSGHLRANAGEMYLTPDEDAPPDRGPYRAAYELRDDLLVVHPIGDAPPGARATLAPDMMTMVFRRRGDAPAEPEAGAEPVSGDEAPKAEPAPEAVESDLAKLQGTWRMKTFRPMPAMQRGKPVDMTWRIEGDRVTIESQAGPKAEMTITLDESAQPRRMDLHDREGDRDTVTRILYDLNGDTLMICAGPPNGPMPTEFRAAPEGEDIPASTLGVFVREPASPEPKAVPAHETTTSELSAAVKGRIVATRPMTMDNMLLAYQPEQRLGTVDNLALANYHGGLRMLLDWVPPPESSLRPGRRYLLALYAREVVGAPGGPVLVFPVRDRWDEHTTWSHMPTYAEEPIAEAQLSGGVGWKLLDVTDLVKRGGRSHGVLIRFRDEDRQLAPDGHSCEFKFVSRDAIGPDDDKAPRLLVVDPPDTAGEAPSF